MLYSYEEERKIVVRLSIYIYIFMNEEIIVEREMYERRNEKRETTALESTCTNTI